MSLSIADAAAEWPERVGLIASGAAWTFETLARRAGEVAPAATRIADRSVETALAIYAALERRAPLVLIHPRLTERERAALPPVPALPADAAFGVYTSGSTGTPKLVVLSRDNLRASAAASAARLGWREDDRWLCPIPLAHVGGLSVLTRCLIARQCAVLDDVNALATHRATIVSMVPAQLARIEARAPDHLRIALIGGAALRSGVRERALALGYPVRATYGLTEACSQVATQARADDPGVGRPLDGVEVDTSTGHIRVRGASVAGSGDWLDTGDLGHLDDGGYLHVTGRADDLIVTGGENVHPAEVEAALVAVPGIEDACVFGVPDETWGQVIAAALVSAAPPDELALEALASFKRPRRICYLADLARTPSGKVDRRATMRTALPHLRPLR